MRRRTQRSLSPAEIALWAHVARSVRPMPGKSPAKLPAAPTMPADAVDAPAKGRPKTTAKPPATGAPVPPKPAPPALKPLVPLERKLKTQLKRGIQPIEAVIDLHGMRQDEAHAALVAFLWRAQGAGAKLVLVVTGKGAAGADGYGAERGVLRRMTPHWLRLPDLRSVVVGFDEADQRHGGAGALYVRLRRGTDTAP